MCDVSVVLSDPPQRLLELLREERSFVTTGYGNAIEQRDAANRREAELKSEVQALDAKCARLLVNEAKRPNEHVLPTTKPINREGTEHLPISEAVKQAVQDQFEAIYSEDNDVPLADIKSMRLADSYNAPKVSRAWYWFKRSRECITAPELTDELKFILGRPNFTLISTAQALRATGRKIEPRAEDEQATCIHWMLGHYLRHGSKWREHAYADLDNEKKAEYQATHNSQVKTS